MTDHNLFLEALFKEAMKYPSEIEELLMDKVLALSNLAYNNSDATLEEILSSPERTKNNKISLFIIKNLHLIEPLVRDNIIFILELVEELILDVLITPEEVDDGVDIMITEWGSSSTYYHSLWFTPTTKGASGFNFESLFQPGVDSEPEPKPRPKVKNTVTFKDVAGIDDIKFEIEEIVDFIKNPKKYSDMGAKIPKGVLLEGLPGVGKTLLAKAIANESGLQFIAKAGSDFVNKYVGVGAKNIRDLFDEAREYGGCIIFIDEIDALAGRRDSETDSERDSTVNQLLFELDGFGSEDDGVILIGATNNIAVLDPAVLRSGRFDRKLKVNLPNKKSRVEILKIHARNKKFRKNVDFDIVARDTTGFSGAGLANLLNEAAINAVRGNRKKITNEDIHEGLERELMGLKSANLPTYEEKVLVSVHEVGHATLEYLIGSMNDVIQSITIVSRSNALGYVRSVQVEETGYTTKREYESELVILLGGVVAEEIFIGEVTSGCSSDLRVATKIAKSYLGKFGMGDSFATFEPTKREIKELIDEKYKEAKEILTKVGEKKFLSLVSKLLEEETIYEKDIKKVLGKRKESKTGYKSLISKLTTKLNKTKIKKATK